MKIRQETIIIGILIFFLNRGLMAEHSQHLFSSPWIKIKHEETGLLVDFPHKPLELTFDVPFQNTPAHGQVHLYSMPTQKGLFVAGTFHSSTLNSDQLSKEQLHHFFEAILVPHFFFNPSVFQDHQVFHFQPSLSNKNKLHSASFQISFQDHGIKQRLEGMTFIHDHTLYIGFYLASEKDFDDKTFNHFLNSISYSSN